MKLVKLKLRNYRCYQQETEFLIDDLTAIVGKNDVGKSTILEALDAFFNDNLDQSDLSNNHDNGTVELTCVFSGLPEKVILDTAVETSPLEEGILNAEGMLEVKKSFSLTGKKSSAIFLNCLYPEDARLNNLLSLKIAPLKARAAELDVDLTDVNKAKSPPIRAKIRESIGGNRALKLIKVDGSLDTEDNLKTIWSGLKKKLPVYSLFKVDKVLNDKDDDIKDPMQLAINEALSLPEVQALLEQVEEKVKEYSTDIAEKTILKLQDFDASLAEKLKSAFSKPPSYSKIFDLTLLNENDIPLNKRGSGIRRLVLLSFFQAQAERRKASDSAPSIIYAIEEPETSQHPNHQLMLIRALKNLSKQANTQVLFTTHNANLVREIPINSLRYVNSNAGAIAIQNGIDPVTNVANEGVINEIVLTLGILPNPADKVKVLVYVEGFHDVNGLQRYSVILNSHDNNILNLAAVESVGYVLTGGSSLKHYVEQKYLAGLGKPEVHIYDSDVPAYVNIVNQINAENNPNKCAFSTSKLELESFLHHEAIQEAYAENATLIALNPINDNDDVPMIVAEALYTAAGNNWAALDPEEQKKFGSSKKGFLNKRAVELMTIDRINARNGFAEIKSWLDKIKTYTAL